MQDLLDRAQRLGLPVKFTFALGMMIRYLFVFGYMYRTINQTLVTRCFNPFDAHLPYRYRIQQLGYTIGTMFIRSYEQGERVYTSILCRGYGKNAHLLVTKKSYKTFEWAFLTLSLTFIILVPVLVYLLIVTG